MTEEDFFVQLDDKYSDYAEVCLCWSLSITFLVTQELSNVTL